MLKKITLLVAVLALVAAACGDDDQPTTTPTTAVPAGTSAPSTTPAPTPGPTPTPTPTAGPTTTPPSVCNDGCAAAWPSLEGEPVAGNGIDGTLLGTAERADGTTQATYNGWPLHPHHLALPLCRWRRRGWVTS